MRTLFFLFIVTSVLTCGCSNKPYQPKEKAESITGTVTFNNKTVTNAEIYFFDSAHGVHFAVKTDAEGKFTVAPNDLPVGSYVTFVTPANPKDIPQKYQNPLESPLILEIKNGNNDLNIVLENKK
ncbi:MAG: carboxypeptidase-like regulatory domain-containing protein [Planctomycetaceae bacterium]|jgi:hypothetical protein|nr:carboxypeptidase-like regulatory domain-containing protein [Planctomycetaceae bacterium]